MRECVLFVKEALVYERNMKDSILIKNFKPILIKNLKPKVIRVMESNYYVKSCEDRSNLEGV